MPLCLPQATACAPCHLLLAACPHLAASSCKRFAALVTWCLATPPPQVPLPPVDDRKKVQEDVDKVRRGHAQCSGRQWHLAEEAFCG